MAKEYVLTTPPLVEVIVEVHWELKPIQTGPGAAIDPFFDIFKNQFGEWIRKLSWTSTERLIPEQFPAELLPHQPQLRFRASKDSWPLYQIGPGLFTANVVPPYGGWSSFRKFVDQGLNALYETYPLSDKVMSISKTELRYINAFLDPLRREPFAEFVSSHLGISSGLPAGLPEKYVANQDSVSVATTTQFAVTKPENSEGIIRVAPGTSGGKEAVVVELISRKTRSPAKTSNPKELMEWFDTAHETIHDWFASMASAELAKRMGPLKEVKQ